jgi:hypothetical protein
MDVVKVVSQGSSRVGKFNLSYEMLGDDVKRPMVQALLAMCTILAQYEHESGRGQEYIAACELFQPLAEGEEIPHYRIEFAFDRAFDNPELEQQRTNAGPFGFVAIRQHILRVPAASLGHAVHSLLH